MSILARLMLLLRLTEVPRVREDLMDGSAIVEGYLWGCLRDSASEDTAKR